MSLKGCGQPQQPSAAGPGSSGSGSGVAGASPAPSAPAAAPAPAPAPAPVPPPAPAPAATGAPAASASGASPPCPPPPVLEIVDRKTGVVVSGTTVTKIVGQKIELLVRANPATPLSNIQWTVPTRNVKSYTQALANGAVTDLSAGDLQAATLDFYWIDGGNKTVQVSATAAGNPPPVSVTFNVLRPTVDHFTTSTSGVHLCVGNYLGGARPGTWMAAYDPTSAKFGCQWDAKVTAPVNGAGKIGFTQLINYDRKKTDNGGNPWKITSGGSFYLDSDLGIQYNGDMTGGVAIAATSSAQMNGWRFADSPGNALEATDQNSSANDSFHLYLMYRPDGADSIWVTLQRANWSWKGETTRIGAPASAANNWNAISGGAMTNDANGADTTDLPVWDHHWEGTWVAGP